MESARRTTLFIVFALSIRSTLIAGQIEGNELVYLSYFQFSTDLKDVTYQEMASIVTDI